MSLALYSPEDVTILLGGIYQIEGLQEGSFLSISKDEDLFKIAVSTDGVVSRTHISSPTFTIKMTLSSVADSNAILTAMAALDSKTYGVAIPLFIKDGNGTSLFYAATCWIEKIAEATFSEDVEDRQWTLRATGVTNVIGGNSFGGIVDTGLAAAGMISADFAGLI